MSEIREFSTAHCDLSSKFEREFWVGGDFFGPSGRYPDTFQLDIRSDWHFKADFIEVKVTRVR